MGPFHRGQLSQAEEARFPEVAIHFPSVIQLFPYNLETCDESTVLPSTRLILRSRKNGNTGTPPRRVSQQGWGGRQTLQGPTLKGSVCFHSRRPT